MLLATELSYDHRGRLLSGSTDVPGGDGRFFIGTLAVEAGLRLPRRFGLDVRLPFYWKSFQESGKPANELLGPGDLELSGSYELLARPKWSATIAVGLAFPTGATSQQPIAGAAVPTPLQLGTGTFDPLFDAAASFRPVPAVLVRAGFDARPVLYANGYSYQAASVYAASLGGEYRFLDGRLQPGVDLEYAHTTHAAVGGAEVPNTGRDVLYVLVRLRARLVQRFEAELGLRVPVYQRVELTQFGETVMVDLRLSYAARREKPPLAHPHEHEHETIVLNR